MEHLMAYAEAHGYEVIERPLKRLRGFYEPQFNLIVLSSLLTEVQKKSTLAHELGHAFFGDRPTSDPRLHDFQERRATFWAAQKIIDTYAYADAEAQYGSHPGALAQALGVTRELIVSWQTHMGKAA